MRTKRTVGRRHLTGSNGTNSQKTAVKNMNRTKSRGASPAAECKVLRKEVAELRAENRAFRKAIGTLMSEPIDFDKKTLLANVGKGQPLLEFIAQIERGEV
jgi:hypothetical protein